MAGDTSSAASGALAAEPGATIEIQTRKGTIRCSPDEIVPKRFGVHLKQRSILLEYEVPRHGLLVHHPIEVNLGSGTSSSSTAGAGGYPSVEPKRDDKLVAEQLQLMHRPWLDNVHIDQLAALVRRVLDATGAAARPSGAGARSAPERPRRERVQVVPETARASKRSKEPEIKKVFDAIAGGADEVGLEDLEAFLCDYLGFGRAEAETFFDRHRQDAGTRLSLDGLSKGYALLNPFTLGPGRQREVIVRKPGSLGGFHQAFSSQQVNLEGLEHCEAYICTPTAQAFVDLCKHCVILLGPCESSIFIRDCEDCVIWLAAQQLRTRDCKRCTFYLYSKTDPIIETSEDLAFAPWCASYPGCAGHFEKLGFDPQRNFWNALFDFNGVAGRSHWRILPLPEARHLRVELSEPPGMAAEPDNPCAEVTHAVLCAAPLVSEESCGQGVANIPQTRPELPPAPDAAVVLPTLLFRDSEGRPTRQIGAEHLGSFPRL